MSTYRSDNENNQPDMQAYYETLASQEEMYLEETEEELRVSLTSDDPSLPQNRGSILAENHGERKPDWNVGRSMIKANNDPRTAWGLDEQLDYAAEELITGDADDPPLGEEAVVEMLRVSSYVRRLGGLEEGIRSLR